ncbi:hypothetical protein Hypma_001934 [Hypsizygus marmoreus]|uniref:Uncharacterized protein n=1 Tax=Hypsizygus marmoreus TaxID=39966 RepID=A0A369J5Q9_HYPMA|nr:hypothetical protein Hypma_001934 [Hypsizygus marmoreus]
MPLANQGHHNQSNSKGGNTCSAAKSFKKLKKVVSRRRRNKPTQQEITDPAHFSEHRSVGGEGPSAPPGHIASPAPLRNVPDMDNPSAPSTEVFADGHNVVGPAPSLEVHQGSAHANAQQTPLDISLETFDAQTPTTDHAVQHHQFFVHNGRTSFFLCPNASVNIAESIVTVTLCHCSMHPQLLSQPIVRNVPLPVPGGHRDLGGPVNHERSAVSGAGQSNHATVDSNDGSIPPPFDAYASTANQSSTLSVPNAPNHGLAAGSSTAESLLFGGAPITTDSQTANALASHQKLSLTAAHLHENERRGLDVEADINQTLSLLDRYAKLEELTLLLRPDHTLLETPMVSAMNLRSLTISVWRDPGPLLDKLVLPNLTSIHIAAYLNFEFPDDFTTKLHNMLVRSGCSLQALSLVGVYPVEGDLRTLLNTHGTGLQKLVICAGRLARSPWTTRGRTISELVLASLTKGVGEACPSLVHLELSPCEGQDGFFLRMASSRKDNERAIKLACGFSHREQHQTDIVGLDRLQTEENMINIITHIIETEHHNR